jgi:hypothetical protein
MSESLDHLKLVEAIISWIRAEYIRHPYLCIFCDSPLREIFEKPYQVSGYYPDVLAEDTPPTITIIGEAKTHVDLLSERSWRQLLAYLYHLKMCPRGVLILSVPRSIEAVAQNILRRAKKILGSNSVTIHIISDFDTAC